MKPQIFLSMLAENRLTQRLARELSQMDHGIEQHLQTLTRTLQRAFPDAQIVYVQNVHESFRRRDGIYVLQVEVKRPTYTESVVVKLNSETKALQDEWSNWESCRPKGPRHDLVLMNLERILDARKKPIALLYQDAEQLIGVDQTMTLESAMLDAVRLGEPLVESVGDLLFQLYERLGLLLYRHSYDDNPQPLSTSASKGDPHGENSGAVTPDAIQSHNSSDAFDFSRLDKHLLINLEKWEEQQSDAFALRAGVTTELDSTPFKLNFRDPVFMFRYLSRQACPREYIPRMLRGRAHGDLHGRNVLVGRVGHRVLWPAVYDYGDMGRNILIAWDFVKLETEFKIRAYPMLFAPTRFTSNVVKLEKFLFEETEKARMSGEWPRLRNPSTPMERLQYLLLEIRRLAMNHLSWGSRSQYWLTEYYFVLALYGLNSVRFDNLTRIEQEGAYLSAGCAAARFAPHERSST